MKNNLINKIKTLLGMEVSLEQMKLADGVTILEADSFETGMEIVILTEDEQRIPLPIGEYELEDGRVLVVVEEGIISEVKEMETEEEVEVEEAPEEMPAEAKQEMETEKSAPKKTIESVVKETFFAEIEALKTENETLKAELSKLKEVKEEVTLSIEEESKPITHNPENTNEVHAFKFGQNRSKSLMDSIIEKINS
jgi:hypothetical protein